MYLSIVATLYCSARFLPEFYHRALAAASEITTDFEIVLVNDGSPDESLDIALSLYRADPRVKVIDLSRNFGHHKAMMTGLRHAQGDFVFLIDCDLEEEPELLKPFFAALASERADVIYGVQQTRKGGLFERTSGALYFALLSALSDSNVPRNILVARLMTRRYVRALVAHRENELVISGLWASTGFKQSPLVVTKHSNSTTTYTISRKIGLLVRSITAYSNKPLIYISYLGAIILTLSVVAMLRLLVVFAVTKTVPAGYTSLFVSVWFLGGLITFCIGIVAIYLSVVFIETKQRPYTIIRELYDHKRRPPGEPNV